MTQTPRDADPSWAVSSWGAGSLQAFANFICPAHQLLIYTLAFLGLDILLILWCPTFKFYGGSELAPSNRAAVNSAD